MVIKLYKTTSEECRVHKALSSELVKTGEMKGEALDILHPTIMLEYNSVYNSYNYAYIPEFSRYYFVDDITVINHYTILTLRHDPLMNWESAIRQSKAQVTRTNKQQGSVYLKDNRIASTAEHFYTHKKLGNGFTPGEEYVLVLASPEGVE